MPDLHAIPELGRTDGALVNGKVLTNATALKGLGGVFFRFIFLGFGCVVDI